MSMDGIARRLLEEVLRNGRTRYGIKFTDASGTRHFRVIVDEDTTIRKDMNEGIEKLGGRISAGPSGGACLCCGGSGRG